MRTPLMDAAMNGHVQVVRFLCQTKKAALNLKNLYGNTALIDAICAGHELVVDILLEAGADPTLKNRAELDALFYAHAKQRQDLIERLNQAITKKQEELSLMNRKPITTYNVLATEFYDQELAPRSATAIAFFLAEATKAAGPILEPMCGSGRFLIPILQAGLAAEGFDASPAMLNALHKKYAQISTNPAPVSLEFVQDFTRDTRYALIFIPYGSWGLITDPHEARLGLKNIYAHLKPGGKCILEIDTIYSAPESTSRHRAVQTRNDGSPLILTLMQQYNAATQLFTASCHYMAPNTGEDEHEVFKQHLYRQEEMFHFLEAAGFSTIICYEGYDKRPPTRHAPVVIYEATR